MVNRPRLKPANDDPEQVQGLERTPVAIIGGGFSGTLLAINIVRQGAGLP
jgi:cation diffusion facilitator CzcD-associated flavoprotein CzcO